MSHDNDPAASRRPTRREFLKRSTATLAGAAVANLSVARSAHAAGSDVIKMALVGCGGRGTGAAIQALHAMDGQANCRLVAMADAFQDRLDGSLQSIQKQCKLPDRVDVPEERRFTGFDACQKAIDCGVDMVLL